MSGKVCSSCNQQRPLSEFLRDKRCRDPEAVRPTCKPCRREKLFQWRQRNASAVKQHLQKGRFSFKGLTKQGYAEILKSQNGLCAICGDPPLSYYSLAIDHDHSHCPGAGNCAACIRGLICVKCNGGLGMFKDDPYILLRAAQYLVRRGLNWGGKLREEPNVAT